MVAPAEISSKLAQSRIVIESSEAGAKTSKQTRADLYSSRCRDGYHDAEYLMSCTRTRGFAG